MTTYFDTKQETCVEFCEECDRKTKHRRFNGVALFMCIEHVHPVSDRWPSKAHLEKPRRDFRDEDKFETFPPNGKTKSVGLFEDE